MISYGRQYIDKKDIDEVVKTLNSHWLTTGPKVELFEKKLKKKVNSKYALVVNSATSALHLSCMAMGLGQNDIVWTSTNTFVSTANAALLCGAKIDLVDINLETYNISTLALEQKLLKAKREKKLPKVVIPVHIGGQPCDMQKIYQLSKKYKFKIIEDASHAIGSKYLKNSIGNCKYSDISVFSLHPVKIITTGEGGVVTTNNKKIYKKIKSLRSHGIVKKISKKSPEDKKRPWMFYQTSLGLNYRMNDIQASLGISQLKKVNFFLKKRNEIAKIYNTSFKNLPLKLPIISKKNYSSFHLYIVLVLKNKKKIKRDNLYKKLYAKGIKCNIHYIPVYKHPFYKKFKFNLKNFPNNEFYFKNAITLPIHPSITKKQIRFIINTIKKIFN